MKICFIGPKCYQLFNSQCATQFGGAEVQLYLVGNAIAESTAAQVDFLVGDFGQQPTESFGKVRVWKSFHQETPAPLKLRKFFQVLDQIGADAYVQMALSVMTPVIAAYCRLRGKTFIYMLAHDQEVETDRGSLAGRARRYFSQQAFRLAHGLVAQNSYQQAQLARRGRSSTVVKSSFAIARNPQHDRHYHLWIARAEQWKRGELFIQLAKRLPDEQFVMICPPFEYQHLGYFEQLKTLAGEVDNLTFIDKYVPFLDLEGYFRKAKSFVNTSTQEGFATTFVQATQNSVPVVSLNSNPDNFIDGYECGFFCADNFEKMVESITELSRDNARYSELCENAFRYCSENHDIKVNAKKILGVITSCFDARL